MEEDAVVRLKLRSWNSDEVTEEHTGGAVSNLQWACHHVSADRQTYVLHMQGNSVVCDIWLLKLVLTCLGLLRENIKSFDVNVRITCTQLWTGHEARIGEKSSIMLPHVE